MDIFLPNIFAIYTGETTWGALAIASCKDVALFALGVLFIALLGKGFQYFGYTISGPLRIIVDRIILPGIFVHESAHALAAILTGAKVTEFSILPQGDTLGHISYEPSKNPILASIQEVCVGVAPAFAGLIGVILILTIGIPNLPLLWQKAIACYFLFCLLCSSGMSKYDVPSFDSVCVLAVIMFFVFLFIPISPEALFQTISHSLMTLIPV